jgi:RNA polymerase sigma-70 factor, ECF subfamily
VTWAWAGNFLALARSHLEAWLRIGRPSLASAQTPNPKPAESQPGTQTHDADSHDIAQFQAGKEVGFNRLVLRHKDKVHSLCFRLLGRGDDALDVAQEVFVRVYQGLPQFRGDAKFSTWLHTVTLNACRNRHASAAHRFGALSESVEDREETLAARTQGGEIEFRVEAMGSAAPRAAEWSSGSPDQDLLRKRREGLLQRGLTSLPYDFRQALILRDVEGRSYEDITALTGWELGTVRSRIHRAREKLREALKGTWE